MSKPEKHNYECLKCGYMWAQGFEETSCPNCYSPELLELVPIEQKHGEPVQPSEVTIDMRHYEQLKRERDELRATVRTLIKMLAEGEQ